MKAKKIAIISSLFLLVSPLLCAEGVPHPNSGGSISGKGNDILTLTILFVILLSLIVFTIYKFRQSER